MSTVEYDTVIGNSVIPRNTENSTVIPLVRYKPYFNTAERYRRTTKLPRWQYRFWSKICHL